MSRDCRKAVKQSWGSGGAVSTGLKDFGGMRCVVSSTQALRRSAAVTNSGVRLFCLLFRTPLRHARALLRFR